MMKDRPRTCEGPGEASPVFFPRRQPVAHLAGLRQAPVVRGDSQRPRWMRLRDPRPSDRDSRGSGRTWPGGPFHATMIGHGWTIMVDSGPDVDRPLRRGLVLDRAGGR